MEVASLGLQIKSDGVDAATKSLTAFTQGASAAERAAQKVATSADAAGKSSEEFSKRVQRQIEQMQFNTAQLARSSQEQERYTALKRAGVTAESAAGDAITKSVRALQQQREVQQAATDAARQATEAARAAQQAAAESVRIEQQRSEAARKVAADLEFERTQMVRTAAEQEKFNALRKAGVTPDSPAGQTITASVGAIQAQRAAQQQLAESTRQATEADRVAQQQQADKARSVSNVTAALEFERAQLGRNASEREKYEAIRKAGVSASSAEGQKISASVTALQAQRTAVENAGKATTLTGAATKAAGSAIGELVSQLKFLAIAYISVEGARALWETGLKAGDLGEQAEQIGINSEQLQAYRLAAAQAGIEAEQLDGALTKLQKAMGSAADGNKEMIERFQQLGVKLLDAQGQLRPVADVLPEVAKGVLGIASSSQRTAVLMDIFGKSGAKMATVLNDMASGNDALIASARQQNAIISPQAIAAWDALGDRMLVTRQKFATLVGEFGAEYALPVIDKLNSMLEGTKRELEGIAALWKWIMANMDAAKTASILSTAAPAQADVKNLQDRLDALRQNPTQFGFKASEKALTDQMAAMQEASNRAQTIAKQAAMQQDETNARRGQLPVSAPPLGANENLGSRGVGSPAVKGAGDAEAKAYQKVIDTAKDYIATKNAETAAIGMNVEAAARLKHETELTAKATNDNTVLTAAQVAQIKALAGAMAEADSKFATAKFMDDATTKSNEFVAAQQIERDTLFMSAEAADAYRISQGYLNDAKSKGIILSAGEVAGLNQLAAAQAAAAAKTRQTTELIQFGKDVATGFFTDISQGLRSGASAWDVFGNAASNVLDKITAKLTQMAIDDLFSAAFGGAKGAAGGASGGLFSGLGGLLGGLFGGGGGGMAAAGTAGSAFFGPIAPAGFANGGVFDRGREIAFANGAAFDHGNVVRFAGGGIVSSPTNFAMADGRTGLMGEAGEEAIMPLARGPGGRLGVSVHGGGSPSPTTPAPQILQIHLMSDMLDAKIASGANVQIVKASPAIQGGAVKQATRLAPAAVSRQSAEREGEWRTRGAN